MRVFADPSDEAPHGPAGGSRRVAAFHVSLLRDHLVFVRAGKNSLHREAIAADPDRNWDCCVSSYAGPPLDGAPAEYHDDTGINKFDAFQATYGRLFAALPYRFIMLLDDDLKFEPGGISRFFSLCDAHALHLAQPALAWGSYISHPLTLWNPVCTVRRVNFVEVMAPCFSRPTLAELLPTFSLTRSTWGIDYAWSSLLDGQNRISIVDAVRMQHTKPIDPVGGPFYRLMRSLGVDPEQERTQALQRYAGWGPMRTLQTGHHYRWPLRDTVNRLAMQLMERRKTAAHIHQTSSGRPPRHGLQ